MRSDSVTIIGMGYVGLSTAVCLADKGFKVYGVDIDAKKLSTLRRGIPTIHESGLPEMLQKSIQSGNLTLTDSLDKAVESSFLSFITVGTPSRPDGNMETKYLLAALKGIAQAIRHSKDYHTVVVKSTVLPGTTDRLIRPFLEKATGKKIGRSFGLSVNPEFLREGSAIKDTLQPDALVVGTYEERSKNEVLSLYKRFYDEMPKTIITTPTNAEMIKYAVNSFRGVQLSFLNTLANLATRLEDSDIGEVIEGFSSITKVDQRYLKPGPGFGGSCLPKDMKAMVNILKKKGVDHSLIQSALDVNSSQPVIIIRTIKELVGGISGKKVAVLGLAYKGGTDDIRDSPSIQMVRTLISEGAIVSVYDPAAMQNAKSLLRETVRYAKDEEDCIKGAEVAIIATDWKQFSALDPERVRVMMKIPFIFDTRRILKPTRFYGAKVTLITYGRSISQLTQRKDYKPLSSIESSDVV